MMYDHPGRFHLARAKRRRTAHALACFFALLSRLPGCGIGNAGEGSEKFAYDDAVAYCRGNVTRPVALNDDRNILCFDGDVVNGMDLSLVEKLKENGLFVVRSRGGIGKTAIEISNALDAKHATVIPYDYCLSACASFFFVASRTYVHAKTIVAFHFPDLTPLPDCARIEPIRGSEDKRLVAWPCPNYDNSRIQYLLEMEDRFYETRVIDRQYGSPPQSVHMRKYLRSLFEQTAKLPEALWMWNPRFYKTALKTEIAYEGYPASQDEVDALAAKFNLGRIIFDP
jgi:hypothetical protein